MYLEYFGLKDTPFSIAPDPSFLYMSERHREALAHLLYGVSGQGGFIVLTGEVGTGKTTICRCFLEQIPENTDVAFVVNPKLSARELLATICDELKIDYPPGSSIKVFNDLINKYLLDAHAQGHHTVLIIDEAQNLRIDVLEQLRLLTNLETSEKKLLQIILLGQPELKQMLSRVDLRQLAQRITARYHLQSLSREETAAYIQYRLSVAGQKRPLFSHQAIRKIYKLSGGVPRLINLICDRSLLGAYSCNENQVEQEHVKHAMKEMELTRPLVERIHLPKWVFSGTLTGVLVGFGLVMLIWAGRHLLPASSETPASKYAKGMNQSSTPKIQSTPSLKSDNSAVKDPQTQPKAALPNTSQLQQAINDTAIAKSPTARESVSSNQKTDSQSTVSQSTDSKITLPAHNITAMQHILSSQSISNSSRDAYNALMSIWGLQLTGRTHGLVCQQIELSGLRCMHKQGNWRSLLDFNRPAVMHLQNRQGKSFDVALIKVQGGLAQIVVNNYTFWVTRSDLDTYWYGDYSLFWKLPDYLSRLIKPGMITDKNKWLKRKLVEASLTAKIENLNQHFIDSHSMKESIQLFQRSQGLVDDGIVGAVTLIHLNSYIYQHLPQLQGQSE
jgi:general secretion pathway protein A